MNGESKTVAAAMATAARSVRFVPNLGQWRDAAVAFGLKSPTMSIGFRESRITIHQEQEAPLNDSNPRAGSSVHDGHVLELTFPGSNDVCPVGVGPTATQFNYFLGADKSRWRCNLPSFDAMLYENIYDGIDLQITCHDGGVLKYEFHCAVGARAHHSQIRVRYGGASELRIDQRGDLLISTPAGTLRENAPRVWQNIGNERRHIPARFELIDSQTCTIELLAAADPMHSLVIDPAVDWMTYMGGSGVEWGFGLAVDASGRGAVLVTGNTSSTDFEGHANGFHGGSSDVFVARVDLQGTLEWMTYLGGSGELKFDLGRDIALDGNGNALITGWTNSPDFAGAINAPHGLIDAFVARLSASGGLDWMTYLGGTADDLGFGIAVDASGAALVTGQAYSTNFQGANNSHHGGNYDAFAARVLASGTLDWMTYLGGGDQDDANGIVVDADDAALVSGDTWSSNFQGQVNSPLGNRDAFIVRILPSGDVDWMAYFGGSQNEACYAITLDNEGAPLISGATTSLDFVGRNNSHHGGTSGIDGFLASVSPAAAIDWMTYLGGSGEDHALRVASDSAGTAFVSGRTTSTDFEGSDNAFHGGAADGFLARIPTSGSIDWMAYLGGGGDEGGFDIAIYLDTDAMITGRTNSLDFQGQNNSFHGGGSWGDAFVLRIPITSTPGIPGDITGDGFVNINDLLAVIGAWGPCPPPPATCPADISPPPAGDGEVNIDDLLVVISQWTAGG